MIHGISLFSEYSKLMYPFRGMGSIFLLLNSNHCDIEEASSRRTYFCCACQQSWKWASFHTVSTESDITFRGKSLRSENIQQDGGACRGGKAGSVTALKSHGL